MSRLLANKPALLGLLFLAAGLIYFIAISFNITAQQRVITTDQGKNTTTQVVKIKSIFGRDALVNIITGYAKAEVFVNNEVVAVDFPYPKTRTSNRDIRLGDVYRLPLKSGMNELHVVLRDDRYGSKVVVSQQYRFIDFVIGFLAAIPLFYLLFQACLSLFDGCCNKSAGLLKSIKSWKLSFNKLPLIVLATGIVLHLWYAWDMGYIQFQHDYQGHVEYIKFFAQEWFVPLPHKAWEFPQQPFYYIVNGMLYALLADFGIDNGYSLRVISFTTAMLSCVGLVYCYRLLLVLRANILVQTLTLAFLCFIPSIVYLSSRINNDPWAFALASIALFYIVSSYQHNWQKRLVPALVVTSLLFLTKVSALTIELLFFSLLVLSYLRQPETVRPALFKFYLVGMLLLAYTIFRGYYPAAGTVEMVNSGIWPGQDLRPITLHYFFSFNFAELLQQGEASIGGKDNHAITRSFLTYQYGNMLFGEFSYSYWRDRSSGLFFNMQAVMLLGLAVPLGWLAYCFRKKTPLDWVFIGVTFIAIALVLKFALTYPSVSNTDFRYYCPVFFLFAYFFACGIDTLLQRFAMLRRVAFVWLSAFFVGCAVFMLALIQI